MLLTTLRQTLINFAGNPDESWGTPTSGESPTSASAGGVARVPIEQADRNTARLSSGAYTPGQYAAFDHQLGQLEQSGSGTARFPGNPDGLPVQVPERKCATCGKTFRSVHADEKVNCYNCVLDQLCPALPGRHIRCHWRRDGWRMEAFGDVGFRNELTYWWSNENSGGNASHQGLVVRRDQEGAILKMVLSTVASTALCCYDVTFDLVENTIRFASRNRRTVNLDDTHGKRVVLEVLDDIVFDLILAMLPSRMIYAHRPRDITNGCFTA